MNCTTGSTRSKSWMIAAVAMSLWANTLQAVAQEDDRNRGRTDTGPRFISALDAGVVEIPDGAELSAADKAILSQITPEQYLLLMAGQDPAAIGGQDGGTLDGVMAVDAVAAIGDGNANLTYTPIDPCRVIDTREFGTPNHFSAGETRSYTLSGRSDFTEYGGSTGACNLPGNVGVLITERKIRAWALNIVAANPFTGQGNFFAYPADQLVEPLASTINFSNLTPNLNIANGVIVKNCDATGDAGTPEPCPAGDLKFKANFSSARLVVDVAGYFTRPESQIEQATVFDIDTSSGNCVNVTSCTVGGTGRPAGRVAASGSATFEMGASDCTSEPTCPDFVNLYVSNVSGTDCPATTRRSFAVGRVGGPVDGSDFIDVPVSTQAVFDVSEGAPQQVWLNARTDNIASYGVVDANLVCTFIPN